MRVYFLRTLETYAAGGSANYKMNLAQGSPSLLSICVRGIFVMLITDLTFVSEYWRVHGMLQHAWVSEGD